MAKPMNQWQLIRAKILDTSDAQQACADWRAASLSVVFTNGCFDLLHRGHLHLLAQARDLGDRLIVGLNSDHSVKKLKGDHRPILREADRALAMAALQMVDAVVIFEEDTPYQLIKMLQPEILVKGGDYKIDEIVGADLVKKNGGQVTVVPILEGFSTTALVQHLRENAPPQD